MATHGPSFNFDDSVATKVKVIYFFREHIFFSCTCTLVCLSVAYMYSVVSPRTPVRYSKTLTFFVCSSKNTFFAIVSLPKTRA